MKLYKIVGLVRANSEEEARRHFSRYGGVDSLIFTEVLEE